MSTIETTKPKFWRHDNPVFMIVATGVMVAAAAVTLPAILQDLHHQPLNAQDTTAHGLLTVGWALFDGIGAVALVTFIRRAFQS